jgi:2-oxoglutarate dehydrogenase E2 component (dihydrolipoamide succinyltransferase)
VNASLVKDQTSGETMVRFNRSCDVGMAFASPRRGLILPTIRNCHIKSVKEVDADVKRIQSLIAKGDKPGYEDMAPATFTISNGGAFGSLMGTPILVPPQVAILGMHAIKQRPVAVDGKVAIRPMMYLALTYDHRWLDGKDSVTFLKDVVAALESPVCLNALLTSNE